MTQDDRYQKHLSLQDRYDIEDGLNHGYTIKKIADKVCKDSTTISKEIRKHRIGDESYSKHSNDCMYRHYCQKQSMCPDCEKNKRCCTCRKNDCRSFCQDYRSDMCRNTTRAPYVCNGCQCIYDCRKPHFFYRANVAYDTYKALLKDTREGISLSRQQLYELDRLLTPLLKRGQSISHIYTSHKEEIPCSMKSLYNYIDQGIFTARNIDLPKKVKYKSRKKKRKEPTVDFAYREGRTYKDFQAFMQEHPESNVIEMDTVHGSNKMGKVMLTLLFRNCNLMLIFLMPDCTEECVKNIFDRFEEALGLETFKNTFPLILTDNGPEFKRPEAVEKSCSKGERTKVFFCDPLASWQKAKLEKNHTYIRKVIPKGTTLIGFEQEDMTIIANHINSTARASLNGRTPFELAQLLLDKKLFHAARLKSIPADEIMLKQSLLKH
ncbi:MAG: IS30 family transposase [Clostridia bacterium]|nr:IS30 family transposase [Clostridia bacterium]